MCGKEKMGEIQSVNSILNKENRNKIQYSINAMRIKRDKKSYSEQQAQAKAMYLADKFKNQSGLNFYLKAAWNLTDQYIDWLVDYSQTKDNPCRYFVKVANIKMQ